MGSISRKRVAQAMIAAALGCAPMAEFRVQEDVDFGHFERGIWVRGPWEHVTSSADIDDVVDQLCPAVMRLPHARGHDDGVEYCGLLYVGVDGQFHASAPSGLSVQVEGRPSPAPSKTCIIPVKLNDPTGIRTIEADYHSHPWPSSPITSGGDTAGPKQRYSVRIQFDTTCRIFKFIPHRNEPVPAELYERIGRSWQRIRVLSGADKEFGTIQPPIEVP